ncbi:hypothetical protein [Paenibacillus sp. Marseille-Q4541]|uniref:hypothetical protein n=1 Tax=Paenibacillus sp. Marseille-Q4541 TaxID=2831522 RepID=UPI001BA6BD9C|nr:hypothetical protein [Paenibacillus sp. Marseille-Q4541]
MSEQTGNHLCILAGEAGTVANAVLLLNGWESITLTGKSKIQFFSVALNLQSILD